MTDFRPIRRQDRLLNIPAAELLLDKGEYGFLAMCAPEGYGYGIPISYVFVRERNCLYLHCAPEGHKLDAITANDRVSFCVVGQTRVYPYTTAYESVHLFGRIGIVEGDEERWDALHRLRTKYNPELGDAPDDYMRKSLPRTVVLRLDVEHVSGKAKHIPAPAGK